MASQNRKILNPHCGYCGRYIGYKIVKFLGRIQRKGSKIFHIDCYKRLEEDIQNYKSGIEKYKANTNT